MSKKYIELKRYYEAGLWNKKRLQNAVAKGWITQEEYEMIVNPTQGPEKVQEAGKEPETDEKQAAAESSQEAAAAQAEIPENSGSNEATDKDGQEGTEQFEESTENTPAGGTR